MDAEGVTKMSSATKEVVWALDALHTVESVSGSGRSWRLVKCGNRETIPQEERKGMKCITVWGAMVGSGW